MAQSFKLDADALRAWLEAAERNGGRIDADKVAKPLHRAIDLLYKLDKLKRDLEASDAEDDEEGDRIALELLSLLNLRRRS